MPTCEGRPLLAFYKALNVNTTATDTVLTIPNGGKYYVVTGVRTANPSTSLSGSSATFGVYTAAAGGGTALVTAATATLTPLTGITTKVDCTIANSPCIISSSLYLFNNVAHGSAATIDVYVYGDVMAF